MTRLLKSFLFLFFTYSIAAQDFPTGVYLQAEHVFEEHRVPYRILFPPNFDSTKTYPLVLFLHGMGERGTDNELQLTHGGDLFLNSMDKYPAIVLFPQCPETDYWASLSRPDEGGRDRVFTFHNGAPNPSLATVLDLTQKLLKTNYVDTTRFYVSGLSMGGFGVWELLWRIPDKIAAATPICAGGNLNKVSEMKEVPIWTFHGEDDSVVHPNLTIQTVEALRAIGGDVKMTLYPGVDHSAWDPAFAEPDFLRWMFSQQN